MLVGLFQRVAFLIVLTTIWLLVFQVLSQQDLFRVVAEIQMYTEAYLGPSQTSMIDCFSEDI